MTKRKKLLIGGIWFKRLRKVKCPVCKGKGCQTCNYRGTLDQVKRA